jgi:glycerophosphoryl diester phosphodiesterase
MNICMAHRGWSGKAPENTMSAIMLAINEPAVKAIEIDVQLSKDGVPVVIHDYTLDRTTNGTGYVKDHTFDELLKLDAGSWFGKTFAGAKIPTLEEVLLAARGKCSVNIELKAAGGQIYPDIERKVVVLIDQLQMQSEVYVTSFNHELVKRVRQINSSIKTGLIIDGRPTLIREQLKETGASALSMAFPYLTPDFVTPLIQEGISIIAWTVNDSVMIEAVAKMHPEIQICTNYPERMINLFKE